MSIETKQNEFETTVEDLIPELELTQVQTSGTTLYRKTTKKGVSGVSILRPFATETAFSDSMTLGTDPNEVKASMGTMTDEIARRLNLYNLYNEAKEAAKLEHGAIAKQLFEDNLTVNPTFPDKPEKPSNDFDRYQDTWGMTDEEVTTFKADRQRADDDYELALELWEEAYDVYETQKAEHYAKLDAQFDGSEELTLSIADVSQWKRYLTGYTIFFHNLIVTPMDTWRDNDYAGYATMIALDGNFPKDFMNIKVDSLVTAIPHDNDHIITYGASYTMRAADTFRVEIKEQGDGHFSGYDLTLNWTNEKIENRTRQYRHAPKAQVNMSSMSGDMGDIEKRIRFLNIARVMGKRWETQDAFISDDYL